MDIRDILKSFDQLTEGDSTVHKAGPGGYGNKHGSEDVTDQYGKPIGRMSLGKLGAQNEPKRGKGRPVNPDKAKEYDSTALNKAMGIGKAPKPTGKPSVKHSLKEYFDQMDEAGLSVQPIPAPKQTGQSFMIKDPANPAAAAITTSDPAVVDAAKKGTLSMQKPGAAPTTGGATPTTGAGSQVAPMEEDGENWIKGAIKHPGAFTKKAKAHDMTPAQFRAKVLSHKEDYSAKTEKQAQLAKTLSKMHEAEAPQNYAQSSPISSNNRSDFALEEGKKGVNPFAKKDDKAEKAGKKVTKDIEYDEKVKDKIHGKKRDSEDNKAEKAGKEVAKHIEYDEKKDKKKKVKEGMDHKLQSARLRGKSHALAQEAYNCHYDDMEEARHYHEGFKEGLDECYGQMPMREGAGLGAVGAGLGALVGGPIGAAIGGGLGGSVDESEVGTMASYGAHDEMDEGNAFTAGLAKTPHGGKFKVGGSTFTDRTRYDSNLDEFAFEALDKQLNAILEGKKVSEGMTVSISKGQQGSPDSVSVSAQDGEADQLLSIIKSAGMGLFGGDEQNGYGAPQGSTQAPGGIEVVDDHDGMMALMKKLSGNGGEMSDGDYESEEEPCNECGYMESQCECGGGDKQVMGEVESEDQMAYKVAEDNPPDNGSANSTNATMGNAAANASLATADQGDEQELDEFFDNQVTVKGGSASGGSSGVSGVSSTGGTSGATGGTSSATGGTSGSSADATNTNSNSAKISENDKEDHKCEHCDCNPCECDDKEKVDEGTRFANLFRKIAMLSEESTSEKDDKAERAAKKVAKDIEYDEGHKGKDDNKAEKAGKEVKKDIEYDDSKDKVDESYANSADDTFEADIEFMTNVISGGLNKQKSTGQTTIGVIAGQKSRMGADGLGNPMKESTDLLKDYMKLSGL